MKNLFVSALSLKPYAICHEVMAQDTLSLRRTKGNE